MRSLPFVLPCLSQSMSQSVLPMVWRFVALTALSGLIASAPPRASAAQTIKVAATPTIRIGDDEAESAQLSDVVAATRLPGGRMLIANRGDQALLLFDDTGRLLQKSGRKGQGPGEVPFLISMHRCGSSIYVIDNERVQEFSLDVQYRRLFRFGGEPSYRQACNARGQFVHMGWENGREMRPGVFRSNVNFWISDASDARGIPLGAFPGSERWGTTTDGKLSGTMPMLLGREPRIAISERAAYIATGDSLSILTFDLKGARQVSLRAPYTPVPTEAADTDREIERDVAFLPVGARDRHAKTLRAIPRPRVLPATRALLVDATGLVWVQSYPRARTPTVTWTVFRPDGAVASRVALPTTLDVLEVGRDYLLGTIRDADTDLPEVRLYPISR